MSGRLDRSRRTRRLAPWAARLISLLGCTLSVPTPAVAQVPTAVPPSRGGLPAAEPWSGVGGDSPPPLTRTRATLPPVRHPALHPDGLSLARPQRLFPRVQDSQKDKRARQEAMKRHPAGKAFVPKAPDADSAATEPAETSRAATSTRPSPGSHTRAPSTATDCGTTYTVRSGDSLWAIAASLVDSGSPAQLAKATDEIFDLNRSTIGPDPDVIYPGQSLELPDECSR